jgi:hypothetical protein
VATDIGRDRDRRSAFDQADTFRDSDGYIVAVILLWVRDVFDEILPVEMG